MKLQCLECKKTFLYASKKIEPISPEDKHLLVKVGDLVSVGSTIESHVCPYCQSLNIDEYFEPQANIASVKSVDLSEVDSLLKEGYVVHELYAKNAVLVKKEKKKEG